MLEPGPECRRMQALCALVLLLPVLVMLVVLMMMAVVMLHPLRRAPLTTPDIGAMPAEAVPLARGMKPVDLDDLGRDAHGAMACAAERGRLRHGREESDAERTGNTGKKLFH